MLNTILGFLSFEFRVNPDITFEHNVNHTGAKQRGVGGVATPFLIVLRRNSKKWTFLLRENLKVGLFLIA